MMVLLCSSADSSCEEVGSAQTGQDTGHRPRGTHVPPRSSLHSPLSGQNKQLSSARPSTCLPALKPADSEMNLLKIVSKTKPLLKNKAKQQQQNQNNGSRCYVASRSSALPRVIRHYIAPRRARPGPLACADHSRVCTTLRIEQQATDGMGWGSGE